MTENLNSKENPIRNPFKFLDSYTKKDKEIFFGREAELEEIYRKFYKSKILLVYGKSGTGKSSIINCGFVSKIPTEDILVIPVRCGKDPVNNLKSDLKKFSNIDSNDIVEILEDIYNENFKPISLIFDQFEEIFILSSLEDRKNLIEELLRIINCKIRISLVIIFREEYFASFSEFENYIPRLFENRVRIEKLNKLQVKEIIEKPCRICKVGIEQGLSEKIADLLTQISGSIELTYFQILMDKLFKIAIKRSEEQAVLKISDLNEIGDIGNILGDFLNEQLLSMENPSEVETVLKTMISEDGTKKQISQDEIRTSLQKSRNNISDQDTNNILQDLINRRIISEKDEQGYYEIKHDSLAQRIYERLTAEERKLKEIEQLLKNTFNQYLKIGTLINEKTLKYIEPYEEKLELTPEIKEYYEKSKKKIIKQKRRKRNIAIISTALIVIFAVVFGLYNYQEQKKAKLQAKISKSKELANQALLYVEDNPTKAYLLGESAYNIYPTFEAEKAILNAYKNAPFYNKIEGNHFIISKSEKYILATSCLNNNIRLYDFLGNLTAICEGHNGPIQSKSLKFSANEKYIISESVIDSTIRVWNITGNEIFKIDKGGYKLFGFLPNDNIYVLSKNDYQLYDIQGNELSLIEFEKPALKIVVDSLNVAILTSDSVIEVKSLIEFKTIAKSRKFTDIYLGYSKIILDDDNMIILFRANETSYYLWNWATNKIYPLDNNQEYSYRNINIKNDYLIEDSRMKNYRKLIKIRNINTGKEIWKSPKPFIYNLTFINANFFIATENIKTFLFDIDGKKHKTYDGILKEINFQSKLLITINNRNNTVNIFDIKGEKYSSIDLDNILFSRFIDKDKIAIGCKDNTIYIYNIKGNLLYTLKGIPTNSITLWGKFIYFINNTNLLIVCKNGLYSFVLDNENSKEVFFTNFSNFYLKIINEKLFYLHNSPMAINSQTALYDTKLKPLFFSDSIFPFFHLIKFSQDNKYFSIQNNEYFLNSDSVVSKLSLFSLPDFKHVYFGKGLKNKIASRRTGNGIEFINSKDTSCILYSNGIIKYLDKQFNIIDEWVINDIKYCGFFYNSHENWIDMKNGHLIAFNYSDSSLKMYDYVNKDSIIINKLTTHYSSDKLIFIKNGLQLLYYKQTKNELFVLSLNLDTLDIIKPLGKKVMRIYDFKDLLFISSIESEFTLDENNTLRKNEIPQSYFQIYDLNNNKMINECITPDVIEFMYDYSDKSNLLAFIDKTGPSYLHPEFSYLDIRNIKGQSLIKLETMAASDFSEDGKYIVYYDQRKNKLIVFPLDASEVIKRVRELQEFGNICNLDLTLLGNSQTANLQQKTRDEVDSKFLINTPDKEIIKTKEGFDRLLRFYKLRYEWENYYLTAKNNIKKYYWNDYDKLAEISETLLEHTDNIEELNEIAAWALQSVTLKNYIFNNLLLSKIYFKLNKDKEALQIVENVLLDKILVLDYNYLYSYYKPENFKEIIDVLFESIPDDYNRLNNIAWFFYENIKEKELLESALTLAKKSVRIKREAANLDTYAALLYKLGKYKEALPIANEAYKLKLKDGQNNSEYQKRIEDIEKELGIEN